MFQISNDNQNIPHTTPILLSPDDKHKGFQSPDSFSYKQEYSPFVIKNGSYSNSSSKTLYFLTEKKRKISNNKIGVDKRHITALGVVQSLVASVGQSAIGLVDEGHMGPVLVAVGHKRRAVGGAIVNQDELHALHMLAQHALHTAGKRALHIINGNDNRQQNVLVHGHKDGFWSSDTQTTPALWHQGSAYGALQLQN